MITNDNGLGFGIRSIGRGIKKVGKGAVRGVRAGAKVATTGVKTGVKVAKVATKPVVFVAKKVSKAAFNLAVRPVRWQLNKIKGGRAQVIALRAGRARPTAADQAQARRDTKAWLSSKGPHGKMLAYLAEGPLDTTFGTELGAAGVDDAAIVAAAGTLTAIAAKLVTDAAKSGFTRATNAVVDKAASTVQNTVAPSAKAAEETAVTAAETAQEVKTQTAEQAEKVTDEALEGAGFLGEAKNIIKVAADPAGMPKQVAEKVARHSVKLVNSLSPRALSRIGGQPALDVGLRLKSAVQQGRAADIKKLLPLVTQIAAKAAAEVIDLTVPQGPSPSQPAGGSIVLGAAEGVFATEIDSRTGYPVYVDRSVLAATKRRLLLLRNAKVWGVKKGKIPVLATTPARVSEMNAAGLGLLASLAGADETALAAGLSGVDLSGVSMRKAAMVLVPVAAVAALAYWKFKS